MLEARTKSLELIDARSNGRCTRSLAESKRRLVVLVLVAIVSSLVTVQLAYLAAITWAALRMWKRGGVHRVFTMSAILMVLYFWGMTFLVLSILRYMVPIIALLFVVVGAGLFARSPRPAAKLT